MKKKGFSKAFKEVLLATSVDSVEINRLINEHTYNTVPPAIESATTQNHKTKRQIMYRSPIKTRAKTSTATAETTTIKNHKRKKQSIYRSPIKTRAKASATTTTTTSNKNQPAIIARSPIKTRSKRINV